MRGFHPGDSLLGRREGEDHHGGRDTEREGRGREAGPGEGAGGEGERAERTGPTDPRPLKARRKTGSSPTRVETRRPKGAQKNQWLGDESYTSRGSPTSGPRRLGDRTIPVQVAIRPRSSPSPLP